jgi:hypothetical protein
LSEVFTVITTMKNEGAFLMEWVAHHKALGFDRIVICTNDCDDPTRDMALRLQEMGLARHHATKRWERTSIQRAALRQVMQYEAVKAADWLYVCDADEFLVVHLGDGTVRALVGAASEGAEVISVPWRIFGPDGTARYQDQPVTGQFQRGNAPLPQRIAFPKSLFRGLQNVQRIGIHAPVAKPDLGRPLLRELPGGVAHVPQHHPMFVLADYRFAQVNHYALRSLESFLVKRDRGRVNHSDQTMDLDYWQRFDLAEVTCTAIRRYDAAVEGWLARLREDRVLAGLHERAVDWHRARIAALMREPVYQALVQSITKDRAA